MALRFGRNPSASLEALRLYSLLDARTTPATVIADAARVNDFVRGLASGLAESLANPSRVQGFWVQSLFQAMVVGLGGIKLIKEEDVGEFFFDDSDGPGKLPDFRLVRQDGQALLVEVKSVRPKPVFGSHRLRVSDVDALHRYAELTGCRLLLAHYWSAWNVWTLADAAAFERRDGKIIVDMETALKASELGSLGDASIATVPPLTISLVADHSVPQSAALTAPGGSADVEFSVGAVELLGGGDVLEDEVERTIAGFLIRFGRWKLTEKVVVNDHMVERIDLVFAPEEPVAAQGFEVVGQLSSMYSAMYLLATQSEAGEVLGLRHNVSPGSLAGVVPDEYFERPDRILRLWKFVQLPSTSTDDEVDS
ncbi:hypothetical protein [Verrucosispora sp. WMMD573]|uniref:hypothetical protein n=1 Tax=Verrucosispora sp. WMMD573 TaxID=3015149 RepID=UPI00248D00CE|nr:hypothetical protein [Verrucosispora sp. WMMD573]WBB53893.1 hypothetical protein O7601_25575 [Verrucosispora sp. WMMD573]